MPVYRAVRRAALPGGTSSSLRKDLEEPPRSDHLGSLGPGPPPQLAIRRDECDTLVRDLRDDINEGVVTAASGVEDRDAIGDSVRYALTSLAFEDHDHRLGDPPRVNGRSYLVHECSGRSCSVPPPAGRTRADHICCIDQKHSSSLIGGRMAGRPLSPEITSRPARFASITRALLKPASLRALRSHGREKPAPSGPDLVRNPSPRARDDCPRAWSVPRGLPPGGRRVGRRTSRRRD